MNDPTFEDLLAAYLDGTLDEHEQQLFATMLRDPSAAQVYVEACIIDAMLAWEHGTMPTVEPPPMPRPTRTRRRSLWWWVPAFAAMLLLGFVWSRHARNPTRPGEAPTETATRLEPGQELTVGAYQLDMGYVITYLEGVEMTIESPCQLRVLSSESVRLEAGRLTAKVPKTKARFQIESSGKATAHFHPGAAAGVETDIDASEIHVFEGEVDVISSTQEKPVRLTRSKATRIGRTGLPVGVDMDGDRFIQSLHEPADGYPLLVQSFDPVLYLRMGPTSNGVTLANDAPGRAADSGRVYAGRMGRPPFGPGQIGLALRLQGPEKEAYAIVPHHPAATKALTVCAWVRAQSRPRWASIVTQGTGAEGQFQFRLHSDDGGLEVQLRSAHGTMVTLSEPLPLPLGRWHWVAFTSDGTTLTLYRGEQKLGSIPCAGLSAAVTDELGLGVNLGPNGRPATENPSFWDGRIDELALFHRALTATELQQLYHSGMAQRKLQKAD